MNFDPSDEQRMAVESLGRCVTSELLPLVAGRLDRAFEPGLAHEIMAILNPCGIGGGWLPEDGGGMGLDYMTSGLIYGELARLLPDAAGLAYVSEGAAMKIYRQGSEAQKARYLAGMAAGRIIGCCAVTEPGAGSNVRQLLGRKGEVWIAESGTERIRLIRYGSKPE